MHALAFDTHSLQKLPGCKELLSLCDQYPRPVKHACDSDIPPICLPSSCYGSLVKHESRITRMHRTFLKPYSTPAVVATATKSRKRQDTFDREEVRKARLENDPWSDKTRLTSKSVFCLGCKRDIRLDRRNDYYPGLWLKHRGLCQGIARMKALGLKDTNPAGFKDRDSSEEPEGRVPVRRNSMAHVSIDEEQAAHILIEMMSNARSFSSSDSDTSSSYLGS